MPTRHGDVLRHAAGMRLASMRRMFSIALHATRESLDSMPRFVRLNALNNRITRAAQRTKEQKGEMRRAAVRKVRRAAVREVRRAAVHRTGPASPPTHTPRHAARGTPRNP